MNSLVNREVTPTPAMPVHRPHKSTTHEERFYHLRDAEGRPYSTVFVRKEDGVWYGNVAICNPRDQFSRRRGRTLSRRRYFLEGSRFEHGGGWWIGTEMSYEVAEIFFATFVKERFPMLADARNNQTH